jgi:S-adenosylmethionine:tRNA ribosyltransferase-isomerase
MKHPIIPTKIKIDDYNYNLPSEKIAYFPKEIRDESKLLVYQNNTISDKTFHEIADCLSENDILIFNNSKVIHARLIVYNAQELELRSFV